MEILNTNKKIIEFCKIVPNDAPSQFSLTLTFLDMIWVHHDPVSRVFFYEFLGQNTHFMNTFLHRLKKSLSLTLYHYLPVAGRLTWPTDSNSPLVVYKTGDGVAFTIAETASDFHSLSRNEFRDSPELGSLLPDFPTSETQTPVMTLQVTVFPNTGFSIAYVAHHGVMDGKSVSLFMHSWAYICKNGDGFILPLHLTPSFDRSFVEQQAELAQTYPRSFEPQNKSLMLIDTKFPPDVMLGTFRLSSKNIDTLKKSLDAYDINHKSTFTVSSAYVMLCLIKAKNLVSGKTYIGIHVDARGRLEPPISSTYFGNCVVRCGGGTDVKNILGPDGFAVAVESVNKGIDMLKIDGILKLAEKINVNNRDFINEDIPVRFSVAGSSCFELYKVDFGWGKPRKVEMISIAKSGTFYLSDDRDDIGGVEIGVALKKHEAEVFESVFFSGIDEAC